MSEKYHNISELAQILNLKDPKTGKFKTHVIRFWENQIKELKADKIINKRRYYSKSKVELIKYVKFLLTEKGLRIKGVKDLLKKKNKKLDDDLDSSVDIEYQSTFINNKINKILEKLRKLKKINGKKDTY
tara:strand:- start:1079 stop:1468 length:390 start_codon:yes stop_codon:yes gene_type:complete